MKDIAKRTGLGLATISSYLNGEMSGKRTALRSKKPSRNFILR